MNQYQDNLKKHVVMATCPDYIHRWLIHVSLRLITQEKTIKYVSLIALSLVQYFLNIGPSKERKYRHSLDNTNI